MRNPANADYRCPFINGKCVKVSRILDVPAPVCAVYRRRDGSGASPPICTCPKRFFESDVVNDVIKECWVGQKPDKHHVVVAHEVQMEKFGKVDFVIAERDDAKLKIKVFLPVELQAVDITGSVLPEYMALTSSQMADKQPSYGFNWANVRKRFISQLIAKGYFCHHWGTRIVAVVQSDLFDEFQRHAKAPAVSIKDSNIVFMLYQFVWSEVEKRWNFKLERVVPTTHVNVMNAILYEQPPDKQAFERKIIERIQAP